MSSLVARAPDCAPESNRKGIVHTRTPARSTSSCPTTQVGTTSCNERFAAGERRFPGRVVQLVGSDADLPPHLLQHRTEFASYFRYVRQQ